MKNILLSLGAGGVVFAILFLPGLLNLGESIVPGVLVAMVTYFVLARRTFKQVEAIFTRAARNLQTMPPRFELAINEMEKAYALASWQLGVRSQVDSQIGVIHFLKKDFNKALPYLQRSAAFGHWLGVAMLAVVYYKKKDSTELEKTLQLVTKKGKKQSLAWALRAYLTAQRGDRDRAQAILVEGLKKLPDDPKLKDALLAVQNNKKIKMKAYKEQWYQFHLEAPPRQYQQQVMPMRVGKVARRGRW